MKLRMQITKEKEIRFISHLEYVRLLKELSDALNCLLLIPKALIRI